MNADEYQKLAMRTAINGSVDWINVGLGLAGEAGEVADHIKKASFQGHSIDISHLKEELGDVLWYVAETASQLGLSLGQIAEINVEKLYSRKDRGQLQGSGDER